MFFMYFPEEVVKLLFPIQKYWWDFCGGVYSLQERLTKPRKGTEKGIQSVQLRLKNLGFLSLAKKKRKNS